jgi:NAD-dependent dihydropyrimidine dehydrogenase PreA subunit
LKRIFHSSFFVFAAGKNQWYIEIYFYFRKEIYAMAAKTDTAKCTGCGNCVEVCPVEAIALKDDKAVIDADTCVDCGTCVDECPVEAISMD